MGTAKYCNHPPRTDRNQRAASSGSSCLRRRNTCPIRFHVRCIRFACGFLPRPNRPFRVVRQLRQPKEGEGFRTTLTARSAVRRGVPAELDAAGLVRVESQAEAGQPLSKIGQEALCVIPLLESDRKIVGIADNHRFAACLLRAPLPVEQGAST